MRMQMTHLFGLARRRVGRFAGTAAAAMLAMTALSGCTSQQLEGDSPAYLIVDSLAASRGDEPQTFSGTLASDIVTNNTIWEDNLQVTLRLALKDPGSQSNPNTPTTSNLITVDRYHVEFVRADGRNTPGVDVPYAFDGGMTLTVEPSGSTTVVTLVRAQAKAEAPLAALAAPAGGNLVISTIAHVTFYGKDQAGRAVSVTGSIGVNFANYGDPE
jgi:hypothetical protein